MIVILLSFTILSFNIWVALIELGKIWALLYQNESARKRCPRYLVAAYFDYGSCIAVVGSERSGYENISSYRTCTIIDNNTSGNKNISLKSETYFHISGTSYSFVSQKSTCRHDEKSYKAPYYCTGGSGGKVCEQE